MRTRSSYILLFLLSLAFLSCKPDVGLFYSISGEDPLDEGTLNNNLTSYSLVSDGSRLFLAAGGFYRKNVDSSWPESPQALAGLDSITEPLATSAAYTDALYVCFTAAEADSYDLYTTADPSADTLTWTEVTASGDSISHVFSENSVLFAVTGASNDYTLWADAGSGFVEVLTGLPSASNADAAWDGTQYWVIWGDKLYYGIPGGAFTEENLPDEVALDTDDVFGGVYYEASTDTLFVSLRRFDAEDGVYTGDVIAYSDSSWTEHTTGLSPLHDFSGLTTSDGNDLVVVGSDNGYYELNLGVADAIFDGPELSCDSVSYLSLPVSGTVIKDFSVIGDDLYALTVNGGLWKNTDGSWSIE